MISNITLPNPVWLLTEYCILRMKPVTSPTRTRFVLSMVSNCASVMRTGRFTMRASRINLEYSL